MRRHYHWPLFSYFHQLNALVGLLQKFDSRGWVLQSTRVYEASPLAM
jgi:hypothetical protein